MQPFDYYRPKTFEEAFDYLTLPGKVVFPIAGATDFIPTYRDDVWQADAVCDVKALPGVHDLRETTEGLWVGACVLMSELARSSLVRSHWDVLAQGAEVVGSEQVRNRATIGGNLVTASPCADTPPALYVLDALVVLRSKSGERRVPVTEFITFVRKTVLQKGELVAGLVIPKPPSGTVAQYQKLARRKGCDLSLAAVAVLAAPQTGGYAWRIALGAVAPTPIRVPDAEVILSNGHDQASIDLAAKAAEKTARPITDVRSSDVYRYEMVRNLTRRALSNVAAKLK